MNSYALTIVISTYNRVDRLKVSLKCLIEKIENLAVAANVEVLVVNNASNDGTRNYLDSLSPDKVRVIHNSTNQGMLGNLNICALNALGDYVWCLGDDDLIFSDSIEEILQVISQNDVPLIYINYAQLIPTSDGENSEVYRNIPCHLSTSGLYPIQTSIQANSNLMTAIYALILRRDHAILCYAVTSDALPFTTLESCVPTTCYALSLNPMTPTYWIAKPLLAVDLRVSWLNFAPIWILERFPEMMLRFIDWSNQKADFKYIYDEMLEGIRNWLIQPKDTFVHPQTYVFIIAITKMYGSQADLNFLNSHINSPRINGLKV
jgi:glycosyltransferase involved in cell wall biosynthesis